MSRNFQSLAVLAVFAFAGFANAENIIDEHIKAVGGADNIAKIKTLNKTGKVALTGPFGQFEGSMSESYDIAGDKGHRLMDLGIFVIESAWTDESGWQDGPPEGLRDMREDELGMAKMNAAASLVASVKNEYGMAAFKEPTDTKFNDKDCVEVKIVDSPLTVYINKETKLMEGLAASDAVQLMFEDYKAIDDVQFAHKVTTKVEAQNIEIINEFEKIEPNAKLDETLFAKPVVEEEPAEEPAAQE
jgi:hypothetical protein